jgi:hypothetical protein
VAKGGVEKEGAVFTVIAAIEEVTEQPEVAGAIVTRQV